MSIVRCEDCNKFFDLDFEDCSYSDDDTYLCENCSNKSDELTSAQEDLILERYKDDA
jgi:hypothetical protein